MNKTTLSGRFRIGVRNDFMSKQQLRGRSPITTFGDDDLYFYNCNGVGGRSRNEFGNFPLYFITTYVEDQELQASGMTSFLFITANDSMMRDPGQKPSGMTLCDERLIPRTETLRDDTTKQLIPRLINTF